MYFLLFSFFANTAIIFVVSKEVWLVNWVFYIYLPKRIRPIGDILIWKIFNMKRTSQVILYCLLLSDSVQAKQSSETSYKPRHSFFSSPNCFQTLTCNTAFCSCHSYAAHFQFLWWNHKIHSTLFAA